MDRPHRDPGWGAAAGRAWLVVVPPLLFRFLYLSSQAGIVVVRAVWLGFAAVLAGLAIVVSAIIPVAGGGPLWYAAVVVAAGVAAMRLIRRSVRRPMDASNPGALADDYRAAFLGRCAAATLPAFTGFAGVVITGGAWPLLVGIAAAAPAFAAIAPTAGNIERAERRLRLQGHPLSLWSALTRPVVRR